MKVLLVTLLAAIGLDSASAEMLPPPPPIWEARCDLPGSLASLRFISASGDAYEDDMKVELVSGDNAIPFPVRTGLYRQRGVVPAIPSLCDRVAAFPMGDGKALFLLSIDHRPQWDQLTAVLFDADQFKVLNLKQDIAEIKDRDGEVRFEVRRSNEWVSVRLIREYMKNSNSDGAEDVVEDWLELSVVNGNIRTRWARN